MSSADGWLLVHNTTCLEWPAAETPQLAAAGPLVAVLLAATQLSRPPTAWPAVLLVSLTAAISVAVHGLDSPIPCEPGSAVSGCTLYSAWLWTAIAMLALQVVAPVHAVSDLARALLVEVAVAHAVLSAALWAPAMAGAYGAAATPSRAASLELGALELASDDFSGSNDGWGRAVTLALRSSATILAAQLASEPRPARVWPWLLAGGAALCGAAFIAIADPDGGCASHVLGPNHTCSPRHVVPYCDEGALHADCSVSLRPLLTLASPALAVSLSTRARAWLRSRPRTVQWLAVCLAVAAAAAAGHAAFVLPFRVEADQTGAGVAPDRREPHVALCSVWQSHAAHLFAAAAALLGVGPVLALLMPSAPHALIRQPAHPESRWTVSLPPSDARVP